MTFWRPAVGRALARVDAVGWLTAYVGLLLFVPSLMVVRPLGSAGAPSMLFGLGSLLFWMILFLGVSRRSSPRGHPIRVALCVFLFCVGVSYVIAMSGPISPDEISPADVAILALMSWSGTLLLTQDGIYERARLDTLVWRLALCGGLIACLGLAQFITGQAWVDQISFPGLSGLATATDSSGLATRGGYPRPSGTALHPIEYGVLLAMLLPVALHVGFNHVYRRRWVRWFPGLAIAAIIPLTSSRSAYLGALIALLVCLVGWPRRRRLRVLGIAIAGSLIMIVATPNFVRTVTELFTGAGDDPSVASRTDSFSTAYEFIARDPWFGRGLGTFLPKYRIFDNQYLVLLVTIGLIGTIAFLCLAITAIITMLRLRGRLADDSHRDLAVALTAALCAGFAGLFMFDAFAFPMTMGTLFLILGLAGALNRLGVATTPDRTVTTPDRTVV